ncbi:MAG: hypothetical protein MI919_40900 [Holophagales bacterium]|nr:hypothetical protein [Holophagales bacterium]
MRIRPFRFRPIYWIATLGLFGSAALPALAGEVEKTFPFELGQWVSLDAQEGPVTLHRFQIAEDSGGLKKSRLLRPGRNSAYTEDLEIRLEYSNESTHDWEARIEVEWRDAEGKTIDGYSTKEDLDEGDRHEIFTAQQSTLRYGVSQAREVHLRIAFYPE